MKQDEKQKIYIPEMHSLRSSYAVIFGIKPNKMLFDSKQNADCLKNIFVIRMKIRTQTTASEICIGM